MTQLKPIPILLLILCMPLVFHAQKALTGVWMGKVSNDSSTIRKDQGFEMALTQYREKVYGYSRTSFIVNDTLYFVLKRVKGTIEGDKCEIKDDEIVSYNFPGKIDKGVRVTTTFTLNKQDSTWHLDGSWSTNKTKRFYAVTGKVKMQEQTDPSKSAIFAHLEELNLDKELALVPPPATNKEPVTANPPAKKVVDKVSDKAVTKPVTGDDNKSPDNGNPAKPKVTDPPVVIPSSAKDPVNKPVITPTISTGPVPAAADVNGRTNVYQQTIEFSSDSLSLSLYDNGEVDGDTVSVLLNGKLILSRELLKVSALKANIKTPAGQDEFTLVLYAENLGKYPPNTGLLVVHDGENTYQVRFSADLQQNAAIIFRRKK